MIYETFALFSAFCFGMLAGLAIFKFKLEKLLFAEYSAARDAHKKANEFLCEASAIRERAMKEAELIVRSSVAETILQ